MLYLQELDPGSKEPQALVLERFSWDNTSQGAAVFNKDKIFE